MKRIKQLYIYILILFFFIFCGCSYFNKDMPSYLEYWTGVVKVGRHEVTQGESNKIGDVLNISARKNVELTLFCMNAQGYRLLKPGAFFGNGETVPAPENSFSIKYRDDDASSCSATCSAVTFTPASVILNLTFDDADEGKWFTINGNIYPENMPQLKNDASYSFDFVQNSPPDDIENLDNPFKKYGNTEKYYVTFKVPDRRLKRNQDIMYEVKCYLKESDGSHPLKAEKLLSNDDNLEGSSSKIFKYYFPEQIDNIQYDYSVQVVDSTGLRSVLMTTAPGLGVCMTSNPSISVSGNIYEDLADDYEGNIYYQVEEGVSGVKIDIENITQGAKLTTVIDGGTPVNGNLSDVDLSIGHHTVKTKVTKDGYITAECLRNIDVLCITKPSFSSSDGVDMKTIDDDGYNLWQYSYLSMDKMPYSINKPDEDSSIKKVMIEDNESSETGELDEGKYSIKVTLSKDHCIDKAFELKECVAIKPISFSFLKDDKDNKYKFYIDNHGNTRKYDGKMLFGVNCTETDILLLYWNGTTISSGKHSFTGGGPYNVVLKSKTDYLLFDLKSWRDDGEGQNDEYGDSVPHKFYMPDIKAGNRKDDDSLECKMLRFPFEKSDPHNGLFHITIYYTLLDTSPSS